MKSLVADLDLCAYQERAPKSAKTKAKLNIHALDLSTTKPTGVVAGAVSYPTRRTSLPLLWPASPFPFPWMLIEMNRVLKLRKSPLMYLTCNMLLLRILAGRILEDVTDVPSATIAPPPAITVPPLASTTNDSLHVSEITDPPTSVTIELPTESPPQTDEPINVDEEAPPMILHYFRYPEAESPIMKMI
ncbi:hypothetical protein YC2023_077840 [Brassica napus]